LRRLLQFTYGAIQMSVISEREYNRLSGRASSAKRWGHDNASELAAELVAAQLERHIAKVVADAPPLAADQIERITAILHARTAGRWFPGTGLVGRDRLHASGIYRGSG
jgi:hypothetical protein